MVALADGGLIGRPLGRQQGGSQQQEQGHRHRPTQRTSARASVATAARGATGGRDRKDGGQGRYAAGATAAIGQGTS